MKLIPKTKQQWKAAIRPQVFVLAIWLGGVVILEIIGRRVTSDYDDTWALLGLGGLVVFTLAAHRKVGIWWVERLQQLAARLWRFRARSRIEYGVDFRLLPQVPHKLPPFFFVPMLAALGLVGLLLPFAAYFPTGMRGALVSVSYTVYLVLLGLLWAGLVAGTLTMLALFVAIVHDRFVFAYDGQKPRPLRGEMVTLWGSVLFLAGCASILPEWTPLLFGGVCALVALLAIVLPPGPNVTLLWQRNESPGPVRSYDLRYSIAGEVVLLVLCALSLSVLSQGELLWSAQAAPVMPVTTTLGLIFTWTTFAGLAAYTTIIVRNGTLWRALNPATPTDPDLFVHGDVTTAKRRGLRRQAREAGWNVRFSPARPKRTDVQIRLVDNAAPVQSGVPTQWPLDCTPDMLTEPECSHRLRRRDEVQKRRLLVRGFEKLFKRAARRQFQNGDGFWVAPQYWFVLGLARDVDETSADDREKAMLDEIIGPPFHRLFPRPVRHHFYQIASRLEIDLIFVEDGVRFRRFVRVLRMLFEVYDVYGGRQRAEEKHFVGLPGVRVIIHEFDFDAPFRSDRYPEPDYRDISRARILHVFRDHGDATDESPVPTDVEGLPVPQLV